MASPASIDRPNSIQAVTTPEARQDGAPTTLPQDPTLTTLDVVSGGTTASMPDSAASDTQIPVGLMPPSTPPISSAARLSLAARFYSSAPASSAEPVSSAAPVSPAASVSSAAPVSSIAPPPSLTVPGLSTEAPVTRSKTPFWKLHSALSKSRFMTKPSQTKPSASPTARLSLDIGAARHIRPDEIYERHLNDTLTRALGLLKDRQEHPLYTARQIELECAQVKYQGVVTDSTAGKYGHVTYFLREAEITHILPAVEIPVYGMTEMCGGFREMDKIWAHQTKFDNPSFRWIHLPANNMEWVSKIMLQIHEHYMKPVAPGDSASNPAFASVMQSQVLRPEYWTDQQNSIVGQAYHARFMRPFSDQIRIYPDIGIVPGKGENCVLFMPYLHWERSLAAGHMRCVMADVNNYSFQFDTKDQTEANMRTISFFGCGTDEKLMRRYLRAKLPLHPRRTLDQFYYPTLPDTASRDHDQVVDRYTRDLYNKGELEPDNEGPPMLMVDQCWLWLLGGNTILTCFPHRWTKLPSPNDPTDVFQEIVGSLNESQTRNTIRDAEDLAAFIIDRCAANVLDQRLIKDPTLQFIDFFNRSIGDLMEKQTVCLKFLWRDVKASAGHHSDSLLDISKEFDILEKIKDASEELRMLRYLCDEQREALKMYEKHFSSKGPASLAQRVEERKRKIVKLQEKAKSTYEAITDILELKQQQANISEARSSRESAQAMENLAIEAAKAAEENSRQSNSIMLFTVVTILFLPLSSLASLFGVNAHEFGQGSVRLGIIFAYIFPISAFVIGIAFFLAFNHKIRRLLLLSLEIVGQWLLLPFSPAVNTRSVQRLEATLKNLKRRRRRTAHPEPVRRPAAEVEDGTKESADSP